MINKKTETKKISIFTISILALFIFMLSSQIDAQPTGIEISDNITETAGETEPAVREDEGGTINTLILDVLQQNPRWKAYVGNLTGVLALDDALGQSIFRWELGDEDVTGNIFITRSDDVDWSIVECPTEEIIEGEDTFLGFSSNAADNINRTFNETIHPEIYIGLMPIEENTCRSTSTFVSDEQQDQSTADFPLILLSSNTDIIYATPINKGTQSFNQERQVDFQTIVPDQVGGLTTYYFYAEISS